MLVLGLGPAGSTYILSSNGIIYAYDLYLAKYGRTRSCCAGGIGFTAIQELEETLPTRLWRIVRSCMDRCTRTNVTSFTYIGEDVKVCIDRQDIGVKSLGVVVDRQCFDMCLANEALRHAIFLREPSKANKVVYATGFTNQPPVSSKDLEVVMQQWIDVKEVSDNISISIIKRYSKIGYFWMFPEVKGGIIKVGVGDDINTLLKRGLTIRQVLDKYKERLGIKGKVLKECAATLPLGKWKKSYMTRRGGLYIGTAGGFINPLTGAGIKHAILSGYALATGRMDIVNRMKKEINRGYMIKELLRLLPQNRIDRAMEFLYRERKWFDKENLFSFKNVVLSFLALL